jgi:hypothetical protein
VDSLRKQIVTQFVLGFFSPFGVRRRMPIIQSITRDEVCSVVLDTLLEHGRFPLHADVVDADPPIYLGEQIRVLGDREFLVANIEFYTHASRDGTTARVFTIAAEAVDYFVRAVVSNYMYGVPVL